MPLDKLQWKYFSYTVSSFLPISPPVHRTCASPDLSDPQFPTAFVMAIIGIVDSIVAARENGSKYGYAVSANRDLVAMGMSSVKSTTDR